MKLSILAGATSQVINIFIRDSSSTTGAGLPGLVFNSAGLTAYYALPSAAAVSITLATLAAVTSAYSSGGFKEIDATNMPGWYRFDVPNAALASGRFVSLHLKGATNMAPLPIEIELTAWNNQDGVRGGMTALPNAAAAAANGLMILGANAQAVSFTAGMTISNAGGSALTLSSSGSNGSGLAASGNGTGHGISLTGGATGTGLTATGGGTSGAGVVISGPNGNSNGLTVSGKGTGHGISVTGGDGATGNALNLLSAATNGHGFKSTGTGTGDGMELTAGASGADLDADLVGNITGNLSGSAGSVTGAVGSVTGSVGGNVTGSVASVTAAVTVGTIQNNVITAASIAANAITAAATDTTFDDSIADALLARTNGIEAGITPKMAWRAMASALGGVLAGAATVTVTINELGGTSFTRIQATVDADGNRSAVTLSL